MKTRLSIFCFVIGTVFCSGFLIDWWDHPELTQMQILKKDWGYILLSSLWFIMGMIITFSKDE